MAFLILVDKALERVQQPGSDMIRRQANSKTHRVTARIANEFRFNYLSQKSHIFQLSMSKSNRNRSLPFGMSVIVFFPC